MGKYLAIVGLVGVFWLGGCYQSEPLVYVDPMIELEAKWERKIKPITSNLATAINNPGASLLPDAKRQEIKTLAMALLQNGDITRDAIRIVEACVKQKKRREFETSEEYQARLEVITPDELLFVPLNRVAAEYDADAEAGGGGLFSVSRVHQVMILREVHDTGLFSSIEDEDHYEIALTSINLAETVLRCPSLHLIYEKSGRLMYNKESSREKLILSIPMSLNEARNRETARAFFVVSVDSTLDVIEDSLLYRQQGTGRIRDIQSFDIPAQVKALVTYNQTTKEIISIE